MRSKRSTKSAAAEKTTTVATKSAPVRTPRSRKPATITARAGEPVAVAVSTEVIARRAYEMFVARGFEHGRDLEHWLAAERELRHASESRPSLA